MHDAYAKDGLVILSMNLDDPKDAEVRAKVGEVLKREKVPFTALGPTAKDDIEPIVEAWKISSIPLNVFYGRDGKLAKKIEGADVAELTKVAKELLEKK